LPFFCSILQIVRCNCPDGFFVVEGVCRGTYTSVSVRKLDALTVAIDKCQEIGKHPVIIRNEDDQRDMLARFLISTSQDEGYVIGLTCNEGSNRWEWIDGSPLSFKPPNGNYDKELDENCAPGCSWYVWR
ncbi:hypothetical protein PMAYCL1PPCAC_13577, partial [Pristionchus mayeri]